MGNSFQDNHDPLPFKLSMLSVSNFNWKNSYYDLILPNAPSLKFLKLDFLSPPPNCNLINEFIDKCHQLEKLSLKNCHPTLKPSSTITKISLHSTSTQWINKMKNLEQLEVSNQHNMNFDFSQNTKLEVLAIDSCVISSELQIPSVKKLQLSIITDIMPGNLFANGGSIEHLEINFCANMTDKIIKEAVKLKNLKDITVNGGRASRSTIAVVKQQCQNLKSVNFKNLVFIDEL